MKLNKYKFLLEVLIFIVLLVYSYFKIGIPYYNKNFKEGNNYINTKNYNSLIELNIGEANFGLVLNKENIIYHIFYFNNESLCLEKNNIINKELDTSINNIIKELIENNYLKVDTNIILTKYDNNYKDVLTSLNNNLLKYKLTNNITINSNTLIKKTSALTNTVIDSKEEALIYLDAYSKDIEDEVNEITKLDEKTSKKYINEIYKKLENKILENNITNEPKNNNSIDLTNISYNGYSPTKDSYYYVINSKVYAYIKINDSVTTYSYCYNGNIDDYIKGECQ